MVKGTFHFSMIFFLFSILFTFGIFESSFAEKIEPPKKQIKNGIILDDILCKPGKVLVVLNSDKPACLMPETVLKLDERNYIKSVIREFTSNFIDIQDDAFSTTGINISDGNNSQNSASAVSGNPASVTANQIKNIPTSPGSVVNFYITDDDLNTNRGGIDIIETSEILQFFINDSIIEGPETMIETSPNSGQFFIKLQLPSSVNGKPINQDDIVEIRYLDRSDAGGDERITVKSIPLSQTFAQVQTSGGGKTRIGHDFTVRIYEPDANLDSKEVDRIPLSRIEYRGEGGIRTTLANPAFDANGSSLRETGDNTDIFEAIIEIPRTIDGKTIHIGDWYELRYVDISTPSNSSEKIKLRGSIG